MFFSGIKIKDKVYAIKVCRIFILLLFLQACKSSVKTKREIETYRKAGPNIIYIMADDLAIQAISAYGGIYKDIFVTPNIDRIADEGMLFYNVLSTNAICGPSRRKRNCALLSMT